MFPGETITSGASPVCDQCAQRPLWSIRLSDGPPWAIQTWCLCGPYSRETLYIESLARVRMVLDACERAIRLAEKDRDLEVAYFTQVLKAFEVAR